VGETRWAIPVQVRQLVPGDEGAAAPGVSVSAAEESKILLDVDDAVVPLRGPDAVVVVNSGGNGFYRVAYDDSLRSRVAGAAQGQLSTLERYGLVDDTWASVVAGTTSAAAFCQLVRGFAAETDVAVWRTMVAGLSWCDRLLDGEPRERLRAFVRELAKPRLSALGWRAGPDEDDLTGELRGLLIRTMAVLGHDATTQARAAELFEEQLVSPDTVDPPVVAAVVGVVAATAGPAPYERFVERFQSATTPQEQLRYLYALADFPDEDLMARTLEFVLGPEVRTQNAPYVLGRCIANRDRGDQAWRFVREHWDHANAAFPDSSIVRMVDPVKTLTRPDQLVDVAGFFAEHDIPQAAKTLQQVLERQWVNGAVRAREAPDLAAHFGA
jgi:puromycin-sensitive aminopeptidase